MNTLAEYLPIAAAVFAIPQFLPQITRLYRTGDPSGVSLTWAMLTGVSNVAWITYFVLSGFWFALLPSTSAAFLVTVLTIMLLRRQPTPHRSIAITLAWATIIAAASIAGGRTGLGAILVVAFAVQATPSVWTAYRVADPTGISPGTWGLILAELTCWALYGTHKNDTALILMGVTGTTAATLILARIPLRTDAATKPEHQHSHT